MDAVEARFEAIRSGDVIKVCELARANAALVNARNANGVSAVLMACYTGRHEIRDALIASGASVALHEAVAAGKLDRVQGFVEKDGALAHGYSPDGFPLLALAAAFGHEDVTRYLHGKGADVNAVATNGTGYNALTGAVAGNHIAIVKWLAENGANVNYRYAKGHSPLLEAAANGKTEIVKILLTHGADVNARTDAGKSALNFAEERGHAELAAYLQGRGLTA